MRGAAPRRTKARFCEKSTKGGPAASGQTWSLTVQSPTPAGDVSLRNDVQWIWHSDCGQPHETTLCTKFSVTAFGGEPGRQHEILPQLPDEAIEQRSHFLTRLVRSGEPPAPVFKEQADP